MNITTDVRQITPDFEKSFGGYEWWYFDGLSKDAQIGYVIIFYETNPFSTRQIQDLHNNFGSIKSYPAISVSLYKNKETIYYSFLEFEDGSFEWDEEQKSFRIENNSVQYRIDDKGIEFDINIDQRLASGHSLKGFIKGSGLKPADKLIHSESNDQHAWNLLMPAAKIKASFEVNGLHGEERMRFEGSGYHDHNIGQEPMKDSFRDWYWGRYHFDDFTLVYYLMQKHNETQFDAWLIDKENDLVLEHFREADLGYFSRNWFGLNSARKIELEKGQIAVNIQSASKIDDGPFYQRFIGDCIIKYKGQVHAAHGISEYIYPRNIYSKLYWPLVHMRLRYTDEEPSWVQKSPRMYSWTW